MIKINIREFTHHVSDYMERASKGEEFVITKRDQPIADILPHERKAKTTGWSLKMPKVKIKGLVMSQEMMRMREEERS